MNYDHVSRVAKMFFIIDYGLELDESTTNKILTLIQKFCDESEKKIIRGTYKKPPLVISLELLTDDHIDQIYRIVKLFVVLKDGARTGRFQPHATR